MTQILSHSTFSIGLDPCIDDPGLEPILDPSIEELALPGGVMPRPRAPTILLAAMRPSMEPVTEPGRLGGT